MMNKRSNSYFILPTRSVFPVFSFASGLEIAQQVACHIYLKFFSLVPRGFWGGISSDFSKKKCALNGIYLDDWVLRHPLEFCTQGECLALVPVSSLWGEERELSPVGRRRSQGKSPALPCRMPALSTERRTGPGKVRMRGAKDELGKNAHLSPEQTWELSVESVGESEKSPDVNSEPSFCA